MYRGPRPNGYELKASNDSEDLENEFEAAKYSYLLSNFFTLPYVGASR